MNKFGVIALLSVVALCAGEPPVGGGYSYSSGGGSHGSFGGISSYASGFGGGYTDAGFGGGIGGGIGGGGFGGGDYSSVHPGPQTYEGQYVDPALLHKVKEILLDHENLEESTRGHGGAGGFGGYPSSSYGAPSPVYGVPEYNTRVVAIQLGHVNPAIQVAQYHKASYSQGPSGSYGVPSIPSGSYGVPSSSYGVPH